MSASQHPLRQSGIYYNLPTFDPSLTDLKAIVCGATGISGFNTIRALLDTPDRWSAVYALSRSPLPDSLLSLLTASQRSRIQHVSIDLTSDGPGIAASLKEVKVKADYVFYYAYMSPKSDKSAMDPSSAQELVEANVPPFKNLLAALPLAGIAPKRILLQTGGKNYGMHIGRVRTSLVESDPQPRHLSPNFYYQQEDLLHEFCANHAETGWNVVMPAAVIGAVQYASMNTYLSFGVYAAVQAHKKEPLQFGGDWASWQFESCNSTARLTGYLSEWAVLEDKCKNQAFNAQDGGLLSWDRFFHELGRWFGIDDVRGPEADEGKYTVTELAGGEDAPLGYGPPMRLSRSFSLVDWAGRKENKEVWESMMRESEGRLTKNVFEGALDEIFLGDFAYFPFGTLSMSKARRFGWCGFVDTLESIFETLQELSVLGMLPPMQVDAARPLV
jgi:nucleoside-diphosphate-sugar epimerase